MISLSQMLIKEEPQLLLWILINTYPNHNASLTTKIITKNFKQIRLYNNELVNDTVERLKKDKSIPTKIADGLITSNPRTPRFYIPPKIHKETIQVGP